MEIGNKVVVRKDLKVGNEYGMCTFSADMKEFLGKEGTIREINRLGYFYLTIDEKDIYKKFTEEMIIAEEEETEPITEEVVQAVVSGIEEEAKERNISEEQVIEEIKSEMNEEEPEVPEIPDENPIAEEEEETKPAKSGKKSGKKGE